MKFPTQRSTALATTYLMYGLNDKCCVGGTTGACCCCCWGWAGGWFWFWRWDFLEFHLFGFTITWRICEASKAVPGRRSTGDDTWPASTQTMLGYSSSPKSGVSRALSNHGFQTTGMTMKCFVSFNWNLSFNFKKKGIKSFWEFLQNCVKLLPVSGKLYFWSRILRPDTTFVMMCSWFVCWYIRSVHSLIVTTSRPSW